MTQNNPDAMTLNSDDLDDDLLPEYDLTLGERTNRQRAEAIQKYGYAVIIHHEDGTSTTQQIHPSKAMNAPGNYNWQGDRIHGDKVMGDKVGGDKVLGDKIGTQINSSQNLVQAAQGIKALLDQLDRDYDHTTPTKQALRAIGAIEDNPTFKARILNAMKEGGTTAIETLVDHPAVKPLVAMLKGFIDA